MPHASAHSFNSCLQIQAAHHTIGSDHDSCHLLSATCDLYAHCVTVWLPPAPQPGFIGLVCGICFGIMLYYTGKTVTHIKWLLIIMAMVLFFIAAGQVRAAHV